MRPLYFDWLPRRFWLSAAGSTAILILTLLAVGAIDEGAAGDAAESVVLRHTGVTPARTSASGYHR